MSEHFCFEPTVTLRPSNAPSELWSTNQVETLCKELGIQRQDTRALAGHLNAAARTYLMMKASDPPRASDILMELRKLLGGLSRCADQMQRLPDEARTLLWVNAAKAGREGLEQFVRPVAESPFAEKKWSNCNFATQGIEGIAEDMKGLLRLEALVRGIVEQHPADKGGRNEAVFGLEAYISTLARTFEEITERPATSKFSYDKAEKIYWGPFFEFVRANLQIADPSFQPTNQALGSKIRNTLKKLAAKRSASRRSAAETKTDL